jgi:hypothetical protein
MNTINDKGGNKTLTPQPPLLEERGRKTLENNRLFTKEGEKKLLAFDSEILHCVQE